MNITATLPVGISKTATLGNKKSEPVLLVLDVGHGNANVIQENGVTILVDTGTKAKLRQHLQQLGISQVDTVILSHSDYDHIGGLVGLLTDGFAIKRVLMNADADKSSQAWDDLIFALDGAEQRGEIEITLGLKTGPIEIQGLMDVSLEVAAPSLLLAARGAGARDRQGRQVTSNSVSAVIRVLCDKSPVALLTGDMDEVSLDEITRKGVDISARFLVFPHHGGLPGDADPRQFTQTLLESVQPETVLFSHGREKHANPNEVVLATVLAFKKTVIGCTQLSKRCAKEIPDAERSFDESFFSSGREKKICCVGTIRIPLKTGVVSEPTNSSHLEFILKHVPNAQCRNPM